MNALRLQSLVLICADRANRQGQGVIGHRPEKDRVLFEALSGKPPELSEGQGPAGG